MLKSGVLGGAVVTVLEMSVRRMQVEGGSCSMSN